jgi:hypothetical protein
VPCAGSSGATPAARPHLSTDGANCQASAVLGVCVEPGNPLVLNLGAGPVHRAVVAGASGGDRVVDQAAELARPSAW